LSFWSVSGSFVGLWILHRAQCRKSLQVFLLAAGIYVFNRPCRRDLRTLAWYHQRAAEQGPAAAVHPATACFKPARPCCMCGILFSVARHARGRAVRLVSESVETDGFSPVRAGQKPFRTAETRSCHMTEPGAKTPSSPSPAAERAASISGTRGGGTTHTARLRRCAAHFA